MTTVLVVDDESDIRELLVDTLLGAGFQVIEAASGVAALERASRDLPDIVLLDIWMPGMDGYEVLRRLKGDPDTDKIPVVLLTAMPAFEGEQVGMELGVSHYISKPWEPGVVEAALRVALSEAGSPVITGSDDDDDGLAGDSRSVDLGGDGNVAFGAKSVDLKVKDAQIFSMQSGMARLQSARKKQPVDGEETKVIKTGEKLVALERSMGGGIALGSVTLAVGSASSGKSVLCQHFTFGALEEGYGAAFFSSEHSPESLATQMASIGLDVSKHLRTQKLGVYGVPEAGQGEDAGPLLAELALSIERLSLGSQFIVIDSLTDLAGSAPQQAVIAFFTNCRRMSAQGRTIFVAIHPYAFGAEMFTRLRSLCDGYLSLNSEQMMGKMLRGLEVNKIKSIELTDGTTVSFTVEREVGMRMLPVSKVRA